MINNKYKLIALILACAALLFFLIGVIWFGSTIGNVDEESLKITSDVKEIEVGWDYQLEVQKSINAGHNLEYSSSNSEVISISETGYMTARSVGEATITVSIKEKKKIKDSITIKVIEAKSKLNLSERSVYLTPNTERKIYVYNTNPEGYLIWESKDEFVATVNDGVIKAINYGETEVIVTNEEEASETIKVKVLSPEEEETIELQHISFYENDLGLDVGEKYKLTVIFDPRNVTDKTLVWESSNPSAVTVGNDGEITAVGDGNATIIAKASNGLIARCETKSTTHIIPATGLKLDNTDVKMYVGDGYTLKATITPNNTTSKNITWTSSNPSVATVSRGIIIAIKEGTTTITASTNNGKTATAKVTVSKKVIEPYSVAIDKPKVTINVGGKTTLLASITPYNATNKSITWSTSDPTIINVQNGVVTGLKAGTATVTVKTSNGKTATSTVTVSKEAINVTSITLNSNQIKLNANSTYTLKVTYSPSNATNQSVTWSSSNTNVATVSNGIVRGLKGGTATITAKTSNGVTATCTVEVTKADDVITIRKRTSSYTGNPIQASISARSGKIKSITYYSNSSCTTKTNTSNANVEGGPPKESGTYYVIVETNDSSYYNGIKSPCTEAVVINKKKAVITCTNKPYNGKQQTIATCNGGNISNALQTNVGSYQIACTGTGAYTDATPKSCNITQRSISQAVVTGLVDKTYTGHAIEQVPTVKITIDGETKTLTNNVDYTYRITNNVYPGNASVTISGKGNYNSSKTVYFKILKEPAILSCQNKVFNGTVQVIATCEGGNPTNANKTDAGSYEVGCSPDSNHSAPETKTCSITPYNFNYDEVHFSEISPKPFTGNPITNVSFTVWINLGGTQSHYQMRTSDYSTTFSNNINVGPAARITITGKGNFRGTASTSFEIEKATAVLNCQNKVYNGNSQTIAKCEGGSLINASQTNAGRYEVGCRGDTNHNDASSTICSIAQAEDKPVITLKTVNYTGQEVKANVSAKTCGSSSCQVTYYVNSSCSDSSRTNSSQTGGGASVTGGPPKYNNVSTGGPKEYWAKATSPGSQSSPYNYVGGTSTCTKAIIIN